MTASRWAVFLIAVVPLPAEAMSRNVAISAGSFFAAATLCEDQHLIAPGQSEDILSALDPYLSKSDKANMAAGQARGKKDSQVFIEAEKKWMAFTPDETNCSNVQGVLDDYKAQLAE